MSFLLLAHTPSGWAPAVQSFFPSAESDEQASTFRSRAAALRFRDSVIALFGYREFAVLAVSGVVSFGPGSIAISVAESA